MISLKNKKGDMPSLIVTMIVLLIILAVGALVFSKAFTATTDELQKKTDIFSNRSIENMQNVEEKSTTYLDYLVFFFIVASLIGLVISSLFIDTHPAMMVIFVIVLIIAVVLAGVIANAYTEVAEQDELSATAAEFTLTNTVFNILPLLVFIAGIIVIIVLYGKSKQGGVSV